MSGRGTAPARSTGTGPSPGRRAPRHALSKSKREVCHRPCEAKNFPGMRVSSRTMKYTARARALPECLAATGRAQSFRGLVCRYFWNDGRVYCGQWANNRTCICTMSLWCLRQEHVQFVRMSGQGTFTWRDGRKLGPSQTAGLIALVTAIP